MKRILLLILVLLVCGHPTAVVAQAGRSDVTEVLRQLLAKPVPAPQAETTTAETDKPPRPRSFYDDDKPPADDAPFDDLFDYWRGRTYGRPTDRVRQRLFEASMADPESLSALIDFVPDNPETAAKIKQLYDTAQGDQKFDDHWRSEVKSWLVFNSNYFVNELLVRTQKIKVNKYGSVENTDALVALAKVDWATAEPLLRNFANSGQPRQATLALTLFYNHSMAEKDHAAAERYGNSLKAIASDRNQPGSARYNAIDTLSSTEWSGRDEWYLSLFQDETMLELRDGQNVFSPLTTLFATDPEKWIPIMARLTESKDLAVRSGAASCLITFQNQRARKDALLPLLPWLSDPGWAKDQSDNRLRLIQSMQNVDLPESVPGLIWAVENDEHGSTRTYAAHSLARYSDPRAIPALKRSLSREKEEDDIVRIIQGLLACHGLTEEELLEAIEAYALKTLTPEGIEELAPYRRSGLPPLTIPLLIGRVLVNQEAANEALVKAVLQRAEALKERNPQVAQALLTIAHKWTGRQVDWDLINRIGNGSANAETIVQALERRSQLRESLELELRGLLAASGPAQGVAAVLLADSSFAQSILSSDDQLAQIALLASSRLTQTGLPVELVSPLLRNKNDLLSFAAERYLLSEDSKEARQALWERHPNEAFVAGWRETIEYLEESYAVMDELEKKLRAELFKDDGPTEIYAFLSISVDYTKILRVYNDRVVYTDQEDASRYRERTVSKAELAAFKDFISQNGVEDRGPVFGYCHHDCLSTEYLKLTKERGRRVFSRSGFSSEWQLIRQKFELLGRGDNAKLHYSLEKEIKGLEILFADKNFKVQDVWTQDSEVRLFVEREETKAEQNEQSKLYQREQEEEESEFATMERHRKIAASNKARFSWRTLANGRVDRITTQPQGYVTFDENDFQCCWNCQPLSELHADRFRWIRSS